MTSVSDFDRVERPAKPAATTKEKQARKRLPLLTKITLFSLLIHFTFEVGGLVLSPSRVVFLLVTIPLGFRLLSGAYGRILLPDILVGFFCVWSTLAIFLNNPSGAVAFAGSQLVAVMGAYLVGRATIRSPEDFVALIRFLGWAVVLSLPFSIYEVLTARNLISEVLDQIPGAIVASPGLSDPRFGLYRARVVFDVHIHYSLMCALMFSLIFVGLKPRLGTFWRFVWSGLIGVASFLSVASGPFFSLILQIMLIGWAWITRRLMAKWIVLMCLAVVVYIILEINSNRPAIVAVLSRVAFNPLTAQGRVTIFEQGLIELSRSPLIGIGLAEWDLPPWMTGSIDNFWLLTAVAFGLPSFVFLFGAIALSLLGIGLRRFPEDHIVSYLRRGWVLSITSMCFTLATVAVWGQAYSLCLFLFASGLWLAAYEIPTDENTADTDDPVGETVSKPSYTRFARIERQRPQASAEEPDQVSRPKRETKQRAMLRRHQIKPRRDQGQNED